MADFTRLDSQLIIQIVFRLNAAQIKTVFRQECRYINIQAYLMIFQLIDIINQFKWFSEIVYCKY